MKPTFSPTDGPRLSVFDPIHDRRFELGTSSPVRPIRIDTDRFTVPTDNAVEIDTARLVLPYFVEAHIRHGDGTLVRELERDSREKLAAAEYCIELHAPIKLSLFVESEVTVTSALERVAFDFGAETTVRVGARSYHERPADTVRTTADAEDVMAAISTFGSALKTTSPERSFPTLRGHPPAIELGDRLEIPDRLTPPDTGIHIEIPPERERVYVVAPLAYYLGATVVPGERSRIVTDSGFEHSLDADRGFDAEVERVLKQVLFFDCLVRTEGLYPVELHERRAVEGNVELPLADLYDESLSERLDAYLSVPFDAVRDAVPTWRLSMSVTPEADNVALLPYLVDELAVVQRATAGTSGRTRATTPSYVDEFVRSGESSRSASFARPAELTRSTEFGRSMDVRRGREEIDEPYVAPAETDALEQAWLGIGRPFGANKLLRSAFDHRWERTASDGDIDIDIVCNDDRMRAEYDHDDRALYGQRDELPFDVTVHENLTTSALERLLASETDFLHYIGHIDERGFVCADGTLDARSLDETGVETFFLNGCNSYRQGFGLVENGSVGGIVTHGDVGNDGAIAIGRQVARLLNAGFSLRSALAVVGEHRLVAKQYTVIGDGSVEVAQSESSFPALYRLHTDGTDDEYRVKITTYPTADRGIGSLYVPYLDDVDSYFLAGGAIPEFSVSAAELIYLFQLEQLPVFFDGELRWSTELSFDLLS
ncbi:hypothetical protein [Haladaptatus halobius]|uniref:hypothetical protein n=1 Tax=Haladaptatus halobius TaxID=2884875 RepID=UPI001D0AA2A2|nr:hypothetical protein [Haladaptatus halobius]